MRMRGVRALLGQVGGILSRSRRIELGHRDLTISSAFAVRRRSRSAPARGRVALRVERAGLVQHLHHLRRDGEGLRFRSSRFSRDSDKLHVVRSDGLSLDGCRPEPHRSDDRASRRPPSFQFTPRPHRTGRDTASRSPRCTRPPLVGATRARRDGRPRRDDVRPDRRREHGRSRDDDDSCRSRSAAASCSAWRSRKCAEATRLPPRRARRAPERVRSLSRSRKQVRNAASRDGAQKRRDPGKPQQHGSITVVVPKLALEPGTEPDQQLSMAISR